MPVRTQATPETVLDCAADIVALGKTREQCVKDYPAISGRSERYIREVAKATLPEFQDRLLGKLEVLLDKMVDNLTTTYRDIPAGSRAVSLQSSSTRSSYSRIGQLPLRHQLTCTLRLRMGRSVRWRAVRLPVC